MREDCVSGAHLSLGCTGRICWEALQGEPSALSAAIMAPGRDGRAELLGKADPEPSSKAPPSIICFHYVSIPHPPECSKQNKPSSPARMGTSSQRGSRTKNPLPSGGVRSEGCSPQRPRRACLQVAHQSSPLRCGVREGTPGAAQQFAHTRVSMCVLYRGHGERG